MLLDAFLLHSVSITSWRITFPSSSLAVYALPRVRSLIGKMAFSRDTISDRDARLNRGVMSWTSPVRLLFPFSFPISFHYFAYLLSYLILDLSFRWLIPMTHCPMLKAFFPSLFQDTPQSSFRYWLAFYLVTITALYVIDVPFYYIPRMYILLFPSRVLVYTPSCLLHFLHPLSPPVKSS